MTDDNLNGANKITEKEICVCEYALRIRYKKNMCCVQVKQKQNSSWDLICS